jgi:putative ABC transport system permease protein
LEGNSEPQVYLPYQQVPDGYFSFYSPKDLVVRSAANVGSLLPAIRRIIRNADPEQPIANVRTLAQVVQEDTAPRSVQVRVIGAFAALAFLLAGIGIHGLLSFTVSSRKPEIGVRIALGAQRGHILRMVMLQGVRLAAMGVSLGLAFAYVSARAMQALLGGITPGDAVTFGTAAALGILMTFAGSLAPAWRALRIDPIIAIRAE